jgi:hypothetical protein
MTAAEVVGEGRLTAVIWPTYAGAVMVNGDEPMFHTDYLRGQILWGMDNDGYLAGYAQIHVPPGAWTHIIYCRSQFKPGFVTASKIEQPMIFYKPDTIVLYHITERDVVPPSGLIEMG